MEELVTCEGTVHSIIFQNAENGYTVLRLLTEEGEVITVVGCIPCVAPGEHLAVSGVPETHPQHGEQLRAVELERSLPEDEEEIFSYLSSGICKGVGPATARRIVERFGAETLDVLEREPERLTTLKGVTARKAQEIAESFRQHMGLRRLMAFLAQYQLPPVLAMELRRQYGDAALEKVRENPYLLSGEACGVEFSVTDGIAMGMGLAADSDQRLQAAVTFELSHNENNGHVFLPRNKLISATTQLLDSGAELVEQALDSLIERGAVVQEQVAHVEACYLRRLWEAECSACIRLAGLLAADTDRSAQAGRAVDELEAHLTDIDYDKAAAYEKKLRHDVMAHVHTYGEACPKAMPIIHLGATSCYVGDNTDVILMREALLLVRDKLVQVLARLAEFAEQYKALPTLGFTHFQPAQLVTVGKRATLWMNELLMDLEEVEHRIASLKLLGSKGTTGTQASFLELFEGDHEKCRALERKIAAEMGFDAVVPVSGQTYSRKMDYAVLSTLSGIAQSASKFATDLRLLCHLKEVEEPFEKNQIGSSAMPYKRNPMRCERICALARYVMADAVNPAVTASAQWFERTLDDSANKRLSVPEAFLAVDAILSIYANVAGGLVVHEKVIERHVREELPFMASENILMDAVKRGGNRQELHERIRVLSQEAGANVKDCGLSNNLIELIAADPAFSMLSREELTAHLEPARYIGRCPQQVEDFLAHDVQPVLERYAAALQGKETELKV